MKTSIGLQELDDSELDTVSGGLVGGQGGGESMKSVALSSLDSNQLSYYLMGLCPYCKQPLKSQKKKFGCSGCMVVFDED